jgi:hypothetical protein
MSIRFASALGSRHGLAPLRFSRGALRLMIRHTVNENQASAKHTAFDPALVAALRHFARHGLASADAAGAEAKAALVAANSASFDHWLGITRHLDRRLALRIERSVQEASDPLLSAAKAAPDPR